MASMLMRIIMLFLHGGISTVRAIVRDAFKQKIVQAVPGRPSLKGKTDLYYRGWDLNTPDQPIPF